jgi:hypothetical protein
MLSPKIEQMQLKLSLATPLTLPEVKILLKDVYSQLETLKDEVRKLSQDRPRTAQGFGKNVSTS